MEFQLTGNIDFPILILNVRVPKIIFIPFRYASKSIDLLLAVLFVDGYLSGIGHFFSETCHFINNNKFLIGGI